MRLSKTFDAALRLAPGEFLRLRDAATATIACESGVLWITEDGSPLDVFLSAGERHTFDAGAPILVESLAESVAVIGPVFAR